MPENLAEVNKQPNAGLNSRILDANHANGERKDCTQLEPCNNDIQEYKEYVFQKASSNSPDVIFNSGPKEAVVTLSNLFRFSKNHVRLYCGGFGQEVSDNPEYCLEVRLFLEKPGTKLDVMTVNPPRIESKLYQLLMEDKYQTKIIRDFGRGNFFKDVEGTPEYHFATGDDHIYRVEIDTKGKVAEVCFNNKELTNILIEFFDSRIKKPKQEEA